MESSNLYNPELEQLIDAALADGELTEKEKQILFKKAQSFGVDLDEFEMVLDARLVKVKKAAEEKAASSAPKSNKLGDVKKCPSCGAMVQSYQGVCPECGYAFEGVDANSAVKELSNLLQKESDHKKMEKIIDNYPIPMEKASLLAFVTWLRPQSTDNKNPLANSYYKKYAECVNKIKVSFSNDKDLQQFIGYFEADEKSLKKQKIFNLTLKNKWFWIGLAILFVLILILKPKPMNRNPEKTNAAMIEAVEKGDLNKAEQLHANFKDQKFSYLRGGRIALCRAYMNNGQLDKAEEYMYQTGLEDEIFNAYLKNKEYDKADGFVENEAGFESLIEKIQKVIQAMCENGDKEKAKRYLESKKTRMKESFEKYYKQEKSGEKKYNECIKQINELIASY